ncbi:MAG: lysylphosphatidylglycerol synthase transmembrane domain-containing protein [Phycisphaerae bacterium]
MDPSQNEHPVPPDTPERADPAERSPSAGASSNSDAGDVLDPPGLPPRSAPEAGRQIRQYLSGYFWFTLKNVVGWIMILSSWPIGVALPGPGGLPVFIIGFALVTFPGKRKLTTRFLRGRPLRLETALFTFLTTVGSVFVTAVLIYVFAAYSDDVIDFLARRDWRIFNRAGDLLDGIRNHLTGEGPKPLMILGLAVLALGVTWLVMRLMLKAGNLIIVNAPRARRFLRPWLRRRGVRLLPSRRRPGGKGAADEEIIEFDERHRRRFVSTWSYLAPWLRRVVVLSLTIAIFSFVLEPIFVHWQAIAQRTTFLAPVLFVVSVGMLVAFLTAFRALAWRAVLLGMGHHPPVPAMMRVWALTELARYLPQSLWPLSRQTFTTRSVGVPKQDAVSARIIEVGLFLLANFVAAGVWLSLLGYWRLGPGWQGMLMVLAVLAAGLGTVLVHPRLFYPTFNVVLDLLNRPRLASRVSGGRMIVVFGWQLLGLLWQGVAVWLIAARPLELSAWYILPITGAYALAWTAGYVALWAPGGLAVRELALVGTLLLIMPPDTRHDFQRLTEATALCAFIALVLRAWSLAGEAATAALAMLLDYRRTVRLQAPQERHAKPPTVVLKNEAEGH